MKKTFLLLLAFFLTTGCDFLKDDLEDATIYTTVYPIEYLANILYSDYGTVESIYPVGADVNSYKLTNKQIEEYAEADLFIYNGVSDEKKIAKDLINERQDLLIIDAGYDLKKTNCPYGIEQLWLSPNNYLMLAKNIRNQLTDSLTSKVIIESVNKKYDELAETISLMDADLRAIGKEATENASNTLIVTEDVFKFLQDYGFNVISVDPDTVSETTINNITKAYKNDTYKHIIISDNVINEEISKVVENEKITQIHVSKMLNNTMQDDSYINQMQQFIDSIRSIVLSD